MGEKFKNHGEEMTRMVRYKLSMKIWSKAAHWEIFSNIIMQTSLEGEMPDFVDLENALEMDESIKEMVGRSTD